MYAETDSNGHLSIMEIKREEAVKQKRILQEFEFLIQNYAGDNPVGAVAGMVMLSATVRFRITDAPKCKEKSKTK